MTLTEAKAEIARIDREIDDNRDELIKRVGKKPKAPSTSWYHEAWSAHPDLWERECGLFRQRGEMQLVRDNLEAPARARAYVQLRTKRKQCPTCGYYTITA